MIDIGSESALMQQTSSIPIANVTSSSVGLGGSSMGTAPVSPDFVILTHRASVSGETTPLIPRYVLQAMQTTILETRSN